MANKSLIISVLCAVILKGAAFAGPIPPGPSGNYVNNSASVQSAQFNVTSGTVRGALTAGSLVIPAINVATATATQHIGGGIGLTNLNPAEVKAGTIPASVVWHGAAIGTQYGGSGQDWSGIAQGRIPYFAATGTMGTVAAGVANQVLQSGGPSGAPSFTAAPAVLGTNVTAIPPTNLAAGTLPVNVMATSVTASGVTPGVYGGPTQAPQLTIGIDGRVTSAVQYAIPGISSTTVMYDKSYTWTKYQNFLSSVTLPIIDGPTTLTDNLTVSASIQANIAQLNSVDFIPVTSPAYREGRIFYDNVSKTLVVYSDTPATSLNVGEEMWTVARNNTGSIIPDGQVVYITGAVGQVPTIALARADAYTTSRLIGVTTMDFPINGNGKVTVFGKVHDLNTTAFSEGNVLFLSTFTAGGLSETRPVAPNYDSRVGLVLKSHGTDGEISVNPDLSVRIGMGTANQLLGMNAAGSEEQYKTLRSTNISVSNSSGFIDLAVVSVPATAVDLSTVTAQFAAHQAFISTATTRLDTADHNIAALNLAASTAAYLGNVQTFTAAQNIDASVTVDSLTVTGNAFSVGESTLVVKNGRIGIGQPNPGYKMDIYGSSSETPELAVRTNFPNIIRLGAAYIRGNQTWYLDAEKTGVANILFRTSVAAKLDSAPLSLIGPNVGIGTTTPDQKLTVAGNISSISSGTYLTEYAPLIGRNAFNDYLTNGTYIDGTSANWTFHADGHISGSTNGNGSHYLYIGNGGYILPKAYTGTMRFSTTISAGAFVVTVSTSTDYVTWGDIGSYNSATSGQHNIAFTSLPAATAVRFTFTNTNGTATANIRVYDLYIPNLSVERDIVPAIQHNVFRLGNVGIGTTAPKSQLDITGKGWNDGYARGVYSTNYSGATLSSGTVLTMSANYAYSIGFTTNPANGAYSVGTLYDTSCAAAAVCRVCTEGICPVKLDTGASCATTQTAVISGAQGTAVCSNAPDPATTHWQELGQPASFNAAATGGTILIWAHRN